METKHLGTRVLPHLVAFLFVLLSFYCSYSIGLCSLRPLDLLCLPSVLLSLFLSSLLLCFFVSFLFFLL